MGSIEITRRQLFAAGAGTAGTLALASCTPFPAVTPVDGPWDCGIASGLHSPTAAVLWARFAPAALSTVDIGWEVASDPTFGSVVAAGTVTTGPDTDGCAKVLAEGLAEGTRHWYRFRVGDRSSPVGHTKTLPGSDEVPDVTRLAVGSCQEFSSGFYPAWRAVAAADLDAVLFLGDYIYESAGEVSPLWGVRDDPSEGAVDLATYRAKYRMYRTDPDLRAAHAAHAFCPVWDDHEVRDNYHRGTLVEDPARAAAAYRAWFEYQPVWPIDGTRIHRRLRFGRLADLSMLDTRQYRDPNPKRDLLVSTNAAPGSVVHAAGRTLMGVDQREWLFDGLGEAQSDGVTWKVLGQQVMLAPLRAIDLDDPVLGAGPDHAGVYFNVDQWDGYTAERDLLTGFLHDEAISNTAVLTGDIHSFWQASIHLDQEVAASPVVAQEFVCGSISSTAVGFLPDLADAFAGLTKGFSPAFRWVDWKRRGYGLLEMTPEDMHVEYRTVDPRSRFSPDRRTVTFDWPQGTHDVAVGF